MDFPPEGPSEVSGHETRLKLLIIQKDFTHNFHISCVSVDLNRGLMRSSCCSSGLFSWHQTLQWNLWNLMAISCRTCRIFCSIISVDRWRRWTEAVGSWCLVNRWLGLTPAPKNQPDLRVTGRCGLAWPTRCILLLSVAKAAGLPASCAWL